MADKMMKFATRFSNSESIPNFDISTFKPTQLIALLALPEGDEEKFIAAHIPSMQKKFFKYVTMI